MSGGRIFDRPGHPPVDQPPPPGIVLRPLKVTRLAQAVTALALTLSPLAVLPDSAAWIVAPTAVLLSVRGFNAGTVRIEADGLVLTGLLRTRSLRRDQVESVDYWLVRWRTSGGHLRRWHLWPYRQTGIMWPGVSTRSSEVMACLISLVDSWGNKDVG